MGATQLTLHRYPKNQVSNLQAWDASDEHLINTVTELMAVQPIDHCTLINDQFGALACGLSARYPQLALTLISDAKTSQLGVRQNLESNQLCPQINYLNGRQTLTTPTSQVLMKLPKNLNYFREQLQQLSHTLLPGAVILIGAKAKVINHSLLALINEHFGEATASLTFKKTRVISAVFDGNQRQLPSAQVWDVPEYQLTLANQSNVFASSKLDIGARIMLTHMPHGDFTQIIDLGCGNGVLGLRAGQLYPHAQVHFVDDSDMAVTSAASNWQRNGLASDAAHFHWDDCLTHMDEDIQADLVLCNPPFHQGEAITDHIAWQMFVDARQHLAKGGMIQVVGNRHLNYHVKLKRLFGHCDIAASNGKFVILRAIKS
ncbi:methyltransferase [Shewanella sp. NIFS-20-20]|uniref:methyltransferase n=1 Tax=Shewanella sp. NIFS-20-20 TaxID=2853806 RepID=UPI001C486F4B|nr:methyltransferase [Shewanella sp. NIFS-20-20]MBV7317555.1 methyltransferase [Shewanella sp. NIFS-20-20]